MYTDQEIIAIGNLLIDIMNNQNDLIGKEFETVLFQKKSLFNKLKDFIKGNKKEETASSIKILVSHKDNQHLHGMINDSYFRMCQNDKNLYDFQLELVKKINDRINDKIYNYNASDDKLEVSEYTFNKNEMFSVRANNIIDSIKTLLSEKAENSL